MMNKFLLVCKIALSIILISLVVNKIDFLVLREYISSQSGIMALSAGALLVILKSFIAGVRMSVILKLYNFYQSSFSMFRLSLIGNFFAQTTIAFIGGDAVRILGLAKNNIPIRTATSSVLLDKIIGFISLLIICIFALPALLDLIDNSTLKISILIIIAAAICCSTLFLALGLLPNKAREIKIIGVLADFISISRHLYSSMKISVTALALGFIIHLLSVLTVYLIAHFYGCNISLYWALILVPPIMFISTLPISLAGWGVRESAMIVGFGLLGYDVETTLAISVTLGLSLILAGLPGAVLFAFARKKLPSLTATPQTPNQFEFSKDSSNHAPLRT